MRRIVVAASTELAGDERELQFDVRRLEPGDPVEIFVEPERRWARGTFRITTAGDAVVEAVNGETLSFARALGLGLKRVLH
jgi:hypothetical protein